MLKALIFDFDGLILDTEMPEYVSWCEIYAAHGVGLPRDRWIDALGRGQEQAAFEPYAFLAECLGRPVDPDAIRAVRRPRYRSMIAENPVRPGVEDYLRTARERNIKLAIASSSGRDWVEGHLRDRNLLSYFDLTRCGDDVARTKPFPDVYLSALAGLGVGPNDAVAFEDSPNGVRAAKAAGLFCVAVPNPLTAELSLDHADRVVDSLAELRWEELESALVRL